MQGDGLDFCSRDLGLQHEWSSSQLRLTHALASISTDTASTSLGIVHESVNRKRKHEVGMKNHSDQSSNMNQLRVHNIVIILEFKKEGLCYPPSTSPTTDKVRKFGHKFVIGLSLRVLLVRLDVRGRHRLPR